MLIPAITTAKTGLTCLTFIIGGIILLYYISLFIVIFCCKFCTVATKFCTVATINYDMVILHRLAATENVNIIDERIQKSLICHLSLDN